MASQRAGDGRELANTLVPSAVTGGIATGAAIDGWSLPAVGSQGTVIAAALIWVLALPLRELVRRASVSGFSPK